MESLRSCPTEEPQTPGSSSVYQDGQGQGGQDLSVPSVYLDLSLVYGTVYFPHRLDYATSGLLIVCLDKRCVASFGSAFAKKLIEKEYSAVIKGHVDWGRQLGRTGLPSTSIAPACDTEKGPILDMLYDPLSPLYKIESYTKKDEQHPIGMRTAEPGEENAKVWPHTAACATIYPVLAVHYVPAGAQKIYFIRHGCHSGETISPHWPHTPTQSAHGRHRACNRRGLYI